MPANCSPHALKAAFGLAGQVAIVTGGSSGIGRACAEALGAAGCNVAVNYRSGSASAEDVVRGVKECGSEAFAVGADVSVEAEVEAMFEETVRRFGTVHILINNAGIEKPAPFTGMSYAQWRNALAVNLDGQFLCARSAVREFLRRGPQPDISRATGKIVCMSSVHQRIPWAFQVNYAASKGGVRLLMESLAQEFAPQRIRVNGVAPGAIRTPINREAWAAPEAMESLLKLIPYGRVGEPEDVARTVLFLASDLSDYITGATIYVDGGMVLYPCFRGAG
ncbi:MAG TPA: glucose 1-dehydrogenase [Propylenella sp.]